MKVFCDTSFYVGLFDSHDQYHNQSKKITTSLHSENPTFFTTDYVYDEVVTRLISTHPTYGLKRFQSFDSQIFSPTTTMLHISESIFQKARKIFFLRNRDKEWSLTDCTSLVVMEDYGIRDVLTFDRNFKQMGFKIIGV